MKNIVLAFCLLPFAASAQIANTQLSTVPVDTVKGVALVVVDLAVDGRTVFQGVFLPVYRIRQESQFLIVNEPTGQIKAYHTNYFGSDFSPIPKEEVALFLKRDWK